LQKQWVGPEGKFAGEKARVVGDAGGAQDQHDDEQQEINWQDPTGSPEIECFVKVWRIAAVDEDSADQESR
jgi:hypothetical protein